MKKSDRDFSSMLDEGQEVERRLQEFFKQQGYTIITRFDDMLSQNIGVDFEIYDMKRWMFRVEVKTDTKIHKTNNLFIEHKMVRTTKTSKGWLHYCLADYICYHDSIQDIVYLIDWKKLREEASAYPLVRFNNYYDVGCIGYGYLVPVEEAKEKGYIKLTFSLAGDESTTVRT